MKRLIFTLSILICFIGVSRAQVCNGSLNVTIDGSSTNEALDGEESHTQPECNVASGVLNGTITITPEGGTPPYTYDWDDIVGTDDGKDRTALGTGTYSVTIKDANGCEIPIGPIELTEPTPVACTASSPTVGNGDFNILCNGGTGTIEAAGSGGTGAFMYSLDAGTPQASGTFTDVAAGLHTITTTDENGCETTCEVTLTEPTVASCLASSPTVGNDDFNILCNGGTGTIEVAGSGGTGVYTYSLDAGSPQASGTFTDVAAGLHTITTTDENGCETTCEVTLTEPTVASCLASSPTVGNGDFNILCNGGTGTIEAEGSGGTGVYTYSLDAGTPQASGSFTDVAAGLHTITTTDENGCETTCEVTLTEPTPLVAGSCNYVQDLCQLGDGEIKIEVAGGVEPYEIGWTASPVAPNTVAGDLDQASPQTVNTSGGSTTFTGADGNNNYIFTVTDENGCQIP